MGLCNPGFEIFGHNERSFLGFSFFRMYWLCVLFLLVEFWPCVQVLDSIGDKWNNIRGFFGRRVYG